MTHRSLGLRLLIALLAVLLLGLAGLIFYIMDTRDHLRRGVVHIQASEIAAGFLEDGDVAALPRHYAGGELFYTLFAPDGTVRWVSGNLARPFLLRHASLDEMRSAWRWRLPAGRGRIIAVPVPLPGGGTLVVGKDDVLERDVLGALLHARYLHGLVWLLPLGLAAAWLIRWLIAWTLRPIARAAELARQIGPQDLTRRIPEHELPREVVPLARAVNTALDRLTEAIGHERNFVADAAHELRTPLTVLDLRLQKCREDGVVDWPRIEQEMQQLRRRVTQLLSLARQDQAGREGTEQAVTPLPRLVREVVASMIPLFEAQQRAVHVQIQDALQVRGDAEPLRDALRNLLENALTHGAGDVQVCLRRAERDTARLEIADQGWGVDLGKQDELFIRFRKGLQSTPGCGLGLAIVREAVANAGGTVQFVSNRPCVLRLDLQALPAALPRST